MPSTSAKQARTMAGAAHDPAYARKMGIPQHVARDYAEADRGKASNRQRVVKALSGKRDGRRTA